MPILALLVIAALGWWLHSKGELLPALRRWGAVAVLALLAVRMLATGKLLVAGLAAAAALYFWYAAKRGVDDSSAAWRARRLLGVDQDADAEAIHAAWRRTLTSAHPDMGGDAISTQAATDARNLLLGRLRRR